MDYIGLIARTSDFDTCEQHAPIAQLVECPLSEREVMGLNSRGVKNGTSGSLADARVKGLCLEDRVRLVSIC